MGNGRRAEGEPGAHGKEPPPGYIGGRQARDEAAAKRSFLAQYEAEGPPQDEVHRLTGDDENDEAA